MTKHSRGCCSAALMAAAATIALLGSSPADAFLVGSAVCARGAGRSTRSRNTSGLCVTMSPTVATAKAQAAGSEGGSRAIADISVGGRAAEGVDSARRWIKEVKSGDKVIGYVTDTTRFAAFVDVGVVRKGSKVSF